MAMHKCVVYVCAYGYGGQRSISSIILNDIPHYLETGFLTEQIAHQFTQTGCPELQRPSCLCLPNTAISFSTAPLYIICVLLSHYIILLLPPVGAIQFPCFHSYAKLSTQMQQLDTSVYLLEGNVISVQCVGYLTQYIIFAHPPIYLKISHFYFSLQLNKIPPYINISFIFCSTVGGHIGCSQLLAVI